MDADSNDDMKYLYYDDDGDEGSSGGDFSDNADEDEVEGYVVEDEDKDLKMLASICPEIHFSVLKDSDIRARQEDDITQVSTVLSVSRDASCILLRHFNWSISRVHEAWFSDEDSVKKAIGLLDNPVVRFPKAEYLDCGICFEKFPSQGIKSAACGHPYCRDCWAGYISTSISDGPGCLSLRCPDPSCTAFIGQDMINFLASDEDKEKYAHYLYRSYIEDNKKAKWCPAPGCEYAINFTGNDENYDIYCHCTNSFCWSCTDDTHRPVDCETAAKWALKNRAESENTNWILANSKPCPKCKKPIEKNQGCMHMTCRPPCYHQFCWLCLEDWNTHGSRGGYMTCNHYEKDKNKKGHLEQDEQRRVKARNMLGRYTHHYERWASNESSRKKALEDLKEMKNVTILKLRETQSKSETDLKFIIDAWQQIVDCRGILKWTYVYGYYLSEDDKAKTQLFVYMQGQAEYGLERLHQCAEKELAQFLNDEDTSTEFSCFREKLVRLTRVTKNYFENLVTALKNGLVDVKETASTSNSEPKVPNRVIDHTDWSNWSCQNCTFINEDTSKRCEACNGPR